MLGRDGLGFAVIGRSAAGAVGQVDGATVRTRPLNVSGTLILERPLRITSLTHFLRILCLLLRRS